MVQTLNYQQMENNKKRKSKMRKRHACEHGNMERQQTANALSEPRERIPSTLQK